MKTIATAFAVCCALSVADYKGALAAEENVSTVFSWDFNDQQQVDQWGRNCFQDVVCDADAVKARPTSWDPFLVSPHFALKPKVGQYVEIRMKSRYSGKGELFYASSDEGKYNGFSQDKSVSWSINSDGEFHTYQIMPSWLNEPQIIKIRVDLGAPLADEIGKNGTIDVDYIRIVDFNLDQAQETQTADWQAEDLREFLSSSNFDGNLWISPIRKIDPQKVGGNLYLEWSVDSTSEDLPLPIASLRCVSDDSNGSVSLEIPLFNLSTPEGGVYSKNIDLSALSNWGGMIYRWEISTPGAVSLKRVALSKTPLGVGAIEYLDGYQTYPQRFHNGKATIELETTIRNSGGEDLNDFEVVRLSSSKSLTTKFCATQKIDVDPFLGTNPTGDRLTTQSRPTTSNTETTEYLFNAQGVARRAETDVLSPGEGMRVRIVCEVQDVDLKSVRFQINARSTESNETVQTSPIEVPCVLLPEGTLPQNVKYAPEPTPVHSAYEIGAYYFPGWSKRAGWDKIEDAAPIRKPLLGYYDESSPEVVDWQIKWASENGIQFFLVDWYWRHGQIHLDHWINAFQHARYRSYLKWAVMWANHTGSGTHSSEDWEAVTRYWIDHYFKTPEYYTIDGKPVVVIWDQSIVDNDMIAEAAKRGETLKRGEGCARAFEISRNICREAGLPGVYFIAIKWPEHATDEGTIANLKNGSFDATTIYHFMYPGDEAKNKKLYSFRQIVEASKPNWEARAKTGILPFMPNISTGWDSRPWHGYRQIVAYDRSVEEFRRLLEEYKEFADETGVKRVVLGPVNEWGEGSYIEPNAEFGFGMYEAIRDVLCDKPKNGFPMNYTPHEVGLGPYDLPKDQILKPEDHF